MHGVWLESQLPTHCPAVQIWSGPHGAPQAPQFALSVIRFVQYGAPPSGVHLVSVPEQLPVQLPAAHTVPAAHACPQPPQLRLSVWVSTHVGLPASPPHITSAPRGQTAVHDPFTHACARGQTAPQLPQLSVSVAVSTQTGPHAVWPVAPEMIAAAAQPGGVAVDDTRVYSCDTLSGTVSSLPN